MPAKMAVLHPGLQPCGHAACFWLGWLGWLSLGITICDFPFDTCAPQPIAAYPNTYLLCSRMPANVLAACACVYPAHTQLLAEKLAPLGLEMSTTGDALAPATPHTQTSMPQTSTPQASTPQASTPQASTPHAHPATPLTPSTPGTPSSVSGPRARHTQHTLFCTWLGCFA